MLCLWLSRREQLRGVGAWVDGSAHEAPSLWAAHAVVCRIATMAACSFHPFLRPARGASHFLGGGLGLGVPVVSAQDVSEKLRQLKVVAARLTICAATHVHDGAFSGDHGGLGTAIGISEAAREGCGLYVCTPSVTKGGVDSLLLPLQQSQRRVD